MEVSSSGREHCAAQLTLRLINVTYWSLVNVYSLGITVSRRKLEASWWKHYSQIFLVPNSVHHSYCSVLSLWEYLWAVQRCMLVGDCDSQVLLGLGLILQRVEVVHAVQLGITVLFFLSFVLGLFFIQLCCGGVVSRNVVLSPDFLMEAMFKE